MIFKNLFLKFTTTSQQNTNPHNNIIFYFLCKPSNIIFQTLLKIDKKQQSLLSSCHQAHCEVAGKPLIFKWINKKYSF